jgi:hypothetical protein
MAQALLGLAFYLSALAWWGKKLRAKNTPIGRRRLYGILAAAVPLAIPFLDRSNSFGTGEFAFLVAVQTVVAGLGFVTVVYAPEWIVGAPKPVKN